MEPEDDCDRESTNEALLYSYIRITAESRPTETTYLSSRNELLPGKLIYPAVNLRHTHTLRFFVDLLVLIDMFCHTLGNRNVLYCLFTAEKIVTAE